MKDLTKMRKWGNSLCVFSPILASSSRSLSLNPFPFFTSDKHNLYMHFSPAAKMTETSSNSVFTSSLTKLITFRREYFIALPVLPLSSCQKSFSLPDFCKYFVVKIAKFLGKFPVTNTSIFPFLLISIHVMYLPVCLPLN